MFNRHPAQQAGPESTWDERRPSKGPSAPARACCCPARPVVRVSMPATPGRPHPVDIWLCGHHYRASWDALDAAGATIDVAGDPWDELLPEHAGMCRRLG